MVNFNEIKRVINEWDPIGLLAMECPEDEYHPEIADIAKRLKEIHSVEEAARMIKQVFLEWFGEEVKLEECYAAAIKITEPTF